ncbi:hypothetical protein MOJ76_15600 [Bacillus haynesii]|uniref:hypothetical protein n=1 Tax=Bacillus haynesii TaxID=1925021 RepID=UPI00227F8551|nr:hypothetical protein [Bacillus haynesii]MCY8009718.1 hypothetical protein [Bacillus haynesii]
MKKVGIFVVALSIALVLSSFNVKALAAGKTSPETIKQELNKFDKQKDTFEIVYDKLPQGTPTVKFDSVEDFKKAVSEYEKAIKKRNNQVEEFFENPSETTSNKNTFTLAAAAKTKTGTGRIMWFNSENLKWVFAVYMPHDMWIDFKYTYTGSGKSKKFKKITKIKSDSSNFPSSWHQTLSNHSFYDKNRGVKIHIKGYFLLGVNIAGQSAGFKIPDSYTKKYHF